MSDNIIDFNKHRRERIENQPMSEVSLESLMKGLMSAPRNGLMAGVVQSVQEKMTRLLIMTDIASKASDLLSSYGFDPDNFYPEAESVNRYLSGEMDDGERALWNGPFFDWDADDTYNTTVRLVTTIRTTEENEDDTAIQLALELFKLGSGDRVWSRFADGEWVEDGPPAWIFDELDADFGADGASPDDDDEEDGDDWFANEDQNSIYMYAFPNAAMKALTLAGIDTVDQLKAMSDEQLAAIPGLSEKDAKRVRRVLSVDDEGLPF